MIYSFGRNFKARRSLTSLHVIAMILYEEALERMTEVSYQTLRRFRALVWNKILRIT
ncbi:hypothetical protein Mcup_1794 [Metallosphaera cuprina Ar-4]|uniref:Uncharacterized protein n=1 Tax=Metallosphaera cuprina (strain Ar-4) TaxID=1006006 RepID=F4G0T7_METCR|nr:hypothetical protein Mcup_1794 [Metallosphaera cuprina Ar-4]